MYLIARVGLDPLRTNLRAVRFRVAAMSTTFQLPLRSRCANSPSRLSASSEYARVRPPPGRRSPRDDAPSCSSTRSIRTKCNPSPAAFLPAPAHPAESAPAPSSSSLAWKYPAASFSNRLKCPSMSTTRSLITGKWFIGRSVISLPAGRSDTFVLQASRSRLVDHHPARPAHIHPAREAKTRSSSPARA